MQLMEEYEYYKCLGAVFRICKVGQGMEKIFFWNDVWCGETSLKDIFLGLFLIVEDNDVLVES